MGWLTFALLTIFFYSLFDFLVKLSSNRIHGGLASIFFVKMFATGTNLSIGVPFVRIGIVLLASVLGVLILKETVNFKFIIGFILALIGIYLIITK